MLNTFRKRRKRQGKLTLYGEQKDQHNICRCKCASSLPIPILGWFSLCRGIFGFRLYIHLLPQFAFYVTVFNLICYCFPWERFCFVFAVYLFFVRCDFFTCSNCWSSGFLLGVFYLSFRCNYPCCVGFSFPTSSWFT